MIDNEQLKTLIDWPGVLQQPRCSGGHAEVLRNIFGLASKVIAWWTENDYSGTVAIAYQLNIGEIIVLTDSYGSCSGCDAWEDCSDEDARKFINDLCQHAKIFGSVAEAIEWIRASDPRNCPWEFPLEPAKNLIPQLEEYGKVQ